MIQKDVSKEEAGKNYKVLYLKDGRKRQLVLQKLFRAKIFLGLVDSWSISSSRSMCRSRT